MLTPPLRSLSLEWLKVETSPVLVSARKYWCRVWILASSPTWR